MTRPTLPNSAQHKSILQTSNLSSRSSKNTHALSSSIQILEIHHNVYGSQTPSHARLQAHANRSSSWCIGISSGGQCHDLERRHHRTRRHPLRRRHLQARHAFRGTVPKQAPRRQVHQQDVPSQRLRDRRVVPRYPAEPMESNIRRRSRADQYSESSQ